MPAAEQAEGVVAHGVVDARRCRGCRSIAAGRVDGAHEHPPPDARRRRGGRRRSRRRPGGRARGRRRPRRARGRSRWSTALDVDVEDAAAGEPDLEGVVVADAVAVQHAGCPRRPRSGRGRRPRPRRSRRRPSRRRSRPGRPASRRPGGRGADRKVATTVPMPTGSPASPPGQQLLEHLTHRRPPPGPARTPPASDRPRSRQRTAAPPPSLPAPAGSRPPPCAG